MVFPRSFGILLNELMSGHPPYLEAYLTPVQVRSRAGCAVILDKSVVRPTQSCDALRKKIMLTCLYGN